MTPTTWTAGAEITGPYVVARNNARTGIHSDEFAQRQGFTRAVVAAPNHLNFASTLIEQGIGPEWRTRGRLRARFTAPVYDGDPVRAVLTIAGTAGGFAATFVLENAAAMVVATGGATWVSGDSEAAVPAPTPSSPEDDLLDLRALADGERIPGESVMAGAEAVARFCTRNEDALAAPDRVPTPFLSPLLFAPARRFLNERGVGPGMWGEVDIRQHQPLTVDTPYRYEGAVRARRRRGALEIVEFAFAAHDEHGALVCAITHTHLIPHREAVRGDE